MVNALTVQMRKLIRENPKAVQELLKFVGDGDEVRIPRDDNTGYIVFRKVRTLG